MVFETRAYNTYFVGLLVSCLAYARGAFPDQWVPFGRSQLLGCSGDLVTRLRILRTSELPIGVKVHLLTRRVQVQNL